MVTRVVYCFAQAAAMVIVAHSAEPRFGSRLVFPLHHQHNHAPSIVECPNGDFLASWYRGSGERKADDVAIYGARLRRGESEWSKPFVMADTPGFPDGNTAMFVDARKRLWLIWPVVIANTWESCLTTYRISRSYDAGTPAWEWQANIYLKPGEEFAQTMQQALDARLAAKTLPDGSHQQCGGV